MTNGTAVTKIFKSLNSAFISNLLKKTAWIWVWYSLLRLSVDLRKLSSFFYKILPPPNCNWFKYIKQLVFFNGTFRSGMTKNYFFLTLSNINGVISLKIAILWKFLTHLKWTQKDVLQNVRFLYILSESEFPLFFYIWLKYFSMHLTTHIWFDNGLYIIIFKTTTKSEREVLSE